MPTYGRFLQVRDSYKSSPRLLRPRPSVLPIVSGGYRGRLNPDKKQLSVATVGKDSLVMIDFALDVHLVGQSGWWHELVGPAMLAATAIAAAAIAARTATTRQAEQLRHDRELQSVLQTERLAYDREQRNRQHVRDMVDEAAKGVDAAIRVAVPYEGRIVRGTNSRNKNRAAADDESLPTAERIEALKAIMTDIEEIHSLSKPARLAMVDITSEGLRLTMRLGDDHPVVKSHDVFHESLSKRLDVLDSLQGEPLTDEDRSRLGTNDVDAVQRGNDFLIRCREWFQEG